jgi:uncharacterized membrane protein (UPF0127 family)
MLIFFTALLALTACREKSREIIETSPITFIKEGDLRIYRGQTDSVLMELDIEVADNAYEIQTGLMYRDAMKEGQGMLFIFDEEKVHSFYMKNTKFPLDLLFIDADHKVTSISEGAQPLDERGISSQVPVQYVLELNAGTVIQEGLKPGDSVDFRLD